MRKRITDGENRERDSMFEMEAECMRWEYIECRRTVRDIRRKVINHAKLINEITVAAEKYEG